MIPANCTARQWVNADNKCVDVSPTCGEFDPTNGKCLTCVSNLYQLNADGSCTLIVVNCPSNQYADGLVCKNIPAECSVFDYTLKQCKTCIQGYRLNANGVCERILCPDRQAPSGLNGECISVSPLCKDYDKITGICITCNVAGYVPTVDGCKQRTSPLASCRGRQALGFGKCVGAEVNCKDYNLFTLECDKCEAGFEKS